MRSYVGAVLVALLLTVPTACGSSSSYFCTGASTSGCTKVPANASTEAFCAAGSTFSSVEGFANGVKAAKSLAAVGTPPDIDASARAGFVELVERMVDSKNGPDFRSRTRHLSNVEKKHLLDLDTYIGKTCQT
ncbi:MAG: hypothetical protein ACJ72E_10135 [Marmoricola sp.]